MISSRNVRRGLRDAAGHAGGDTPAQAARRVPLACSPSPGIFNAITSQDSELKLEHYVDKVSPKSPSSLKRALLLL